MTALALTFNIGFSQNNEEDMNTLSIFVEYAKAKNYDAAYTPWMELRERNPKFNRAIYKYGEDILEDKINKLKVFFRKGLPVTGWRDLESIDLKYDKQVVTRNKTKV